MKKILDPFQIDYQNPSFAQLYVHDAVHLENLNYGLAGVGKNSSIHLHSILHSFGKNTGMSISSRLKISIPTEIWSLAQWQPQRILAIRWHMNLDYT